MDESVTISVTATNKMFSIVTMSMVNVTASQAGQVLVLSIVPTNHRCISTFSCLLIILQVQIVLIHVLLTHGDRTVLNSVNVPVVQYVIKSLGVVIVFQAIQANHVQNVKTIVLHRQTDGRTDSQRDIFIVIDILHVNKRI